MTKVIYLGKGCPNCGEKEKFIGHLWQSYHCYECGWDESESFEALRFGREYKIKGLSDG